MKRTITGCMSPEALKQWQTNFDDNQHNHRPPPLGHVHVTITYDDGKKATRTIWEWQTKAPGFKWIVATELMDEEEAAECFKGQPYKKLRSFEVDV